jgi:integrase
MAGKEKVRRDKGTGSIYKRTWKNKNGEVVEGKTWWIKYYKRGRAYQEGTKFADKADAQKLLNKRLHEIDRDGKPGVHFDRFKFEDLVRLFVIDRRNKRGIKSIKDAKKRVKALRKNSFKHKRITDITTSAINSYISKRKRQGIANGTVNRELAALKRMFNLGAEHTPPIVNRNLIPTIGMLEENNVKQGFIDSEGYLKLLQLLPAYMRSPVMFAYHTGWRKEEIMGLVWGRVDLKEGAIRLNPDEAKERAAKLLYLEPSLVDLLHKQNLRRSLGCDYVFHNNGRKIKDLRFIWNKACREAGLGYGYKCGKRYNRRWEEKGFKAGPTIHDFRRTAVRNMDRAGIPRKVAMTRTGHKTESIYERYNIVDEADLKNAALRMEKYNRQVVAG